MNTISRRGFLYNSTAAALAGRTAFSVAQSAAQGTLLLVGTQTAGSSKGVYAYRFDAGTGELAQLGMAAATANPTFLAAGPDRKTIFVANELEEFNGQKGGAISSFVLDAKTGMLTPVNQVASKGGATCHVSVDRTGSAAFVANYTGGSAASFKVAADGRLSDAVSFFQYTGQGPNAERQEGPHAHRVTVSPDNKFLLVNDLGLDLIHVYSLDAATATLTPNAVPAWKAPAGSGPRALLFHPNGRWAYCVCELTSQVIVLKWNASTGTLTTKQELQLPLQPHPGPSTGCDIVLDKDARFAYVANRYDDFVATLAVVGDGGGLTFQRRSSCGGKVPRHLTLDPSGKWLLVANQESDTIAVFARDAEMGHLAVTGKTFAISRPQCLVFPLG